MDTIKIKILCNEKRYHCTYYRWDGNFLKNEANLDKVNNENNDRMRCFSDKIFFLFSVIHLFCNILYYNNNKTEIVFLLQGRRQKDSVHTVHKNVLPKSNQKQEYCKATLFLINIQCTL